MVSPNQCKAYDAFTAVRGYAILLTPCKNFIKMEMFLNVRNGVEYFSQKKNENTTKTIVVEPTAKQHDEMAPLAAGYVLPIDFFYDDGTSDRVIVMDIIPA